MLGSLYDQIAPEIEIIGRMQAAAAIAINWNGYEQADDNWVLGAVVRVDGTDYTGNTPAARIVDITCPKGDMNNSADPRDPNTWNPDFDDISPFALALAGQEGYEAVYPGLGGSWKYHADCNCDEYVDFQDIHAFTLRLTDPNAYHQQFPCETCAPPGASESLAGDPASVAAMYRAHLSAALRPAFIQQVRRLIVHLAGTPRGEYWSAVLARLE